MEPWKGTDVAELWLGLPQMEPWKGSDVAGLWSWLPHMGPEIGHEACLSNCTSSLPCFSLSKPDLALPSTFCHPSNINRTDPLVEQGQILLAQGMMLLVEWGLLVAYQDLPRCQW